MRKAISNRPNQAPQWPVTAPLPRRAISKRSAWSHGNTCRATASPAAAALWFRHAAEQGDAAAQFQLAAMYCIGAGVVRNLAEAVKWYRRSAEQGDR